MEELTLAVYSAAVTDSESIPLGARVLVPPALCCVSSISPRPSPFLQLHFRTPRSAQGNSKRQPHRAVSTSTYLTGPESNEERSLGAPSELQYQQQLRHEPSPARPICAHPPLPVRATLLRAVGVLHQG